MKKNVLKTVDAETLLSTPLQPTHFLVNELIPPGLHLFCGNPKAGKSWLMLLLSLKVAQGDELWGFQTNKCSVLYLCLEDNISRIQSRLFNLVDTAPTTLRFAVAADNIDNGLSVQINNYLSSFPDTRLIVIDTLQCIRGFHKDNNAYANDYRDINRLKQIANQHKLTMILVHHLRKLGDRDPLQMVSGTTGLTGAVDGTYVLERNGHANNTAKLYVTGRDVEYQELTLRFENCIWKFESCEKTQEIQKRETPAFLYRVAELMKTQTEWHGTASELVEVLQENETPQNTITKLLNQYHNTFLADQGIQYSYSRTSKARLIHLTASDSCDSCDTEISTEKKPSLPSPAVT